MKGVPESLRQALRPVTVVCGHYGSGKTNFCANLAIDLACEGKHVSLIDLDIVNPYFRATEQRAVLEERGVNLVAPVFAEAGSSLDVPSLTGSITPTLQAAGPDRIVIVDSGGDDAGATALGRYARTIEAAAGGYAMLYVANCFRNLVADPRDALENLREIEAASRLTCTAIVDNAHLQEQTGPETIRAGREYAAELARLASLPVACTTLPEGLDARDVDDAYPIARYVKPPWDQETP